MPSMHLTAPSPPPDDATPFTALTSHASSVRRWDEDLQRDRLLLSVVTTCALLLGFQLAIILFHPSWAGPVTDWLRAAASWPALLLLVAVSRWLSRRRQPEALTWWLFSGGTLCYAIARTWWTVDDTLVYPHGVPFPVLPDLFFVLQYPFYFLAVILLPFGGFWGPRLLALLDALLWMGAAAAISWYFLLAPLFAASALSPLAKAVSLGYPVADLFLLLASLLILLRPLRYSEDLPVVAIILAAFACLIVADAGATFLVLSPAHVYRTGQFPDLFWLAADLLIPVAAVVQLRVVQRVRSGAWLVPDGVDPQRLQDLQGPSAEDVRAALRLFLPLVAALLASVAILLRATADVSAAAGAAGLDWRRMIAPLAVISGLLLLIIMRQAVLFLEMAQLRRDMATTQANEMALRELVRHKEEFLTIVSHELRTPLTSLELFFALVARRLDRLPQREAAALHTALTYSQASVRRLARLADDLVDDARIVHGRMPLHMEQSDLGTIVRAAVEEQRAAEPDRTILLTLPNGPSAPGGGQPVQVHVDAERIGQVVTNYLTNALKYSSLGQPIAARLEVVEGARRSVGERDGEHPGGASKLARVSVRDEGIGVPVAAQAQIWQRFHIVEDNKVQSGSGISLGLGLYICKTIIEAHHGEVGLDSAPGEGSTFWFTLPLALPAPSTPSAPAPSE